MFFLLIIFHYPHVRPSLYAIFLICKMFCIHQVPDIKRSLYTMFLTSNILYIQRSFYVMFLTNVLYIQYSFNQEIVHRTPLGFAVDTISFMFQMKLNMYRRLTHVNSILIKYNLLTGVENLGLADCNKYYVSFRTRNTSIGVEVQAVF